MFARACAEAEARRPCAPSHAQAGAVSSARPPGHARLQPPLRALAGADDGVPSPRAEATICSVTRGAAHRETICGSGQPARVFSPRAHASHCKPFRAPHPYRFTQPCRRLSEQEQSTRVPADAGSAASPRAAAQLRVHEPARSVLSMQPSAGPPGSFSASSLAGPPTGGLSAPAVFSPTG
eukprot:7926264-Pyramimonas_sp.AAC.1